MTPSKKQQQQTKPQPQQPTAPPKSDEVKTAPVPAVATQLGVTKQQATAAKLKEGWKASGKDMEKVTEKQDGKYLIMALGEAQVRIGANGGVDLPQIRSYAKAWDAALIVDELFKKQMEKDAKKTAPKPEPPKAATPGKTTPATKKAADPQIVEHQMQA